MQPFVDLLGLVQPGIDAKTVRAVLRSWGPGKFDAELRFDFGSTVGEVAAPHPTPLSVAREIVADTHGFATALLDVQARLLRPA